MIPVIDGNKPPVGCACFNDAEVETLWTEAPANEFEDFTAEIEQATRDECDALVPVGWDHKVLW